MVAHIFGNRLARVGRKSAEQTEKVAPSPYPPGILAGNVLQRFPGRAPFDSRRSGAAGRASSTGMYLPISGFKKGSERRFTAFEVSFGVHVVDEYRFLGGIVGVKRVVVDGDEVAVLLPGFVVMGFYTRAKPIPPPLRLRHGPKGGDVIAVADSPLI